MKQVKPLTCKLIKYKTDSQANPTILLGLVLEQNNFFVRFKTAKREYQISRSCVLIIEDTSIPFISGVQQ